MELTEDQRKDLEKYKTWDLRTGHEIRLVWNGDGSGKYVRIVIDVCALVGWCMALSHETEAFFYNNYSYRISHYNHSEPIPKTRPMNSEEMTLYCCKLSHEKGKIVHAFRDGNEDGDFTCFAFTEPANSYKLRFPSEPEKIFQFPEVEVL